MRTVGPGSPRLGEGSIGKEVTVLVGRGTDRSSRAVVESFDSLFRDGIATHYFVRFLDTNETEWLEYDRVIWG